MTRNLSTKELLLSARRRSFLGKVKQRLVLKDFSRQVG